MMEDAMVTGCLGGSWLAPTLAMLMLVVLALAAAALVKYLTTRDPAEERAHV